MSCGGKRPFSAIIFISLSNSKVPGERHKEISPDGRILYDGFGAGRIWSFGPNHLTAGNIVSGFGADLIVGGVWQGVSDAINYPGLWTNDRDLAWRRVQAAGVSSAINGTIGGSIGVGIALGVYAFSQVTPVGWVVTGASIVGASLFEISPWGQDIAHTIFDAFDADIDRSLGPLIMP